MCPTWLRALRGLRNGAGGNCGTGEPRRRLERLGRASARFSFAGARKADAAKGRIQLLFKRMETKRETWERGYPCGWRTWTKFTGNALLPRSTLRFRLTTCHGACGRCMCGILMATSFV